MLNKLLVFCREQKMISAGDRVVCAVSGGADSMALLWAMYLLRDKLGITLECAHFNHKLRGEESDRDAAFVRKFCMDYNIMFHYDEANVVSGKKGLEAAAREARYSFLRQLNGKIATAHTADDNAETILMHLIRGTGLKGLGGIMPVNGNVIRPMLMVTRQDVVTFLDDYCISYVEDSSNYSDDFLRNRLRHGIMPLINDENPKFSQNITRTALRLRQDAEFMESNTVLTRNVADLKVMHPALRSRAIAAFLEECGVKEPGMQQIESIEALLYAHSPSASVQMPGGVVIGRCYDVLQPIMQEKMLDTIVLSCPDSVYFGNYRIMTLPANKVVNTKYRFTVSPVGELIVRPRCAEDKITFAYGTKSVKKLFIDQKIPAHQRPFIPVIADSTGLLGICGFGADHSRVINNDNLVDIIIEPLM